MKTSTRTARRKSVALTNSLAPKPELAVIELVPSLLKIGRILVPVDFSDCSLKALQYALRLAQQFASKLTLIHVVESYPIDHLLGFKDAQESNQWKIDQARAYLRRMCGTLTPSHNVSSDDVVLFGKPYHQICEAAKERDADLIIIATHGRTGLERLQLGSTAERVVRYAPCPVLVVREREKEFVESSAITSPEV